MILHRFLSETRKLVEQPILLLFLLGCISLNTLYIVTANLPQSYLDYIQKEEPNLGTVVNNEFKERLEAMPPKKWQSHLVEDTQDLTNTYATYRTEDQAAEMIDVFHITGDYAAKIETKYRQLKPVVTHLTDQETALELGAANATNSFFTFIRNRLVYTIVAESLIFALVLGLYMSTVEKTTKTNFLVLSTKTGRKIKGVKYVVGLLAVNCFYLLLTSVSFGIFATVYSLGDLWGTSMSTQFHLNVYLPIVLEIPFITWIPFNLISYTLASLLFANGLILLAFSFSFCVGLWLRDMVQGFAFIGCISLIILGLIRLSLAQGWWFIFAKLMWTPWALFAIQAHWFTELGPFSVHPWQECLVLGINFVVMMILGLLTRKYYLRKGIN